MVGRFWVDHLNAAQDTGKRFGLRRCVRVNIRGHTMELAGFHDHILRERAVAGLAVMPFF